MSKLITDMAILDAPSNLGLRPPATDVVPGCYKAPWALRDAGILDKLDARDAGAVVPPRYVATWRPGDGVRNGEAIAAYTRKLADRVAEIRAADEFPVLLGGDCSILLGPALALRRQGRFGLAHVDAHSDFREPANSPHVGAAAGEDLALVTGRGHDYLTDIDGLKPYVRDADTIQLGVRDQEDLADFADTGIRYLTSADIHSKGAPAAVEAAREVLVRDDLDGFWIHLDADIFDPSLVPAVDTPTPGGLDAEQVRDLVRGLARLPGAAGLQIAILDPDLDQDGRQAALIVDVLTSALA
ncbi:arginase family protein [Fodinicola acaciae]|uniref:arginase family protein n=1 Tax=Fodinicola acaciae TaxID=2681555 RepID=UPI001C9E4BC1|nr:arginase family protein [Fodinicola acaciae]